MDRFGPRDIARLGCVGIVLATLVLGAVGAPPAARAAAGVPALVFVPGYAAVSRARHLDPVVAAAIAVCLSMAAVTVLGLLMIWAGVWYPRAGVTVLLATSCALLLHDFVTSGGPLRGGS